MDLPAHIAEFDRGRVRRRDGVYVNSAEIEPSEIAAGTSGVVSMRNLGLNGRMANQLLQWAFLNFYAWRHDLRIEAPAFPAGKLVGAATHCPLSTICRRSPMARSKMRRHWRCGSSPHRSPMSISTGISRNCPNAGARIARCSASCCASVPNKPPMRGVRKFRAS